MRSLAAKAMSNSENRAPEASQPPPESGGQTSVTARLHQFQKRQNELWRVTFLLLLVLSTVFAFTSWDTVRSLTHRFEALPIGLVILVCLFAIHVWKRTQEISELRGLVQGIEQRDTAPPNDKQLDQLFERISKSQQGYRDLIDSFDDILIALTLEGEIRAVNRSFADLVRHTIRRNSGQTAVGICARSGWGRVGDGEARAAEVSGTAHLVRRGARAPKKSDQRVLS